MHEQLLKFIRREKLLEKKDLLLLAVSGGVDSMVMADLFLQAKIRFGIAHVNYNLRGEHAIADKELVQEWAQERSVPFHLEEVEAHAYDTKESIQMVARRIRYAFFKAVMKEHGYTKVATAHHLNDSLETVWLNLTKGTGPRGLSGVPLISGTTIRPLMFTSREELLGYAVANGIKWREDASNAKNDYQRNYIRNELTPRLKEINPSLISTYSKTRTRLSGMNALLADVVNRVKEAYLVQDMGCHILDTHWVTRNDKDLLVLSELIADWGFNFSEASDLFQCVLSGQSGRVFSSENYLINLDRGRLLISARGMTEFGEHVIAKGQNWTGAGLNLDFEIHQERMAPEKNKMTAYLDLDKIKWPLCLRSWQQGDKFMPLGMNGRKLVSDFMIDRKIPLTLKKQTRVLTSDGRIIWLIGHRIDERFKVTAATKKTLVIRAIHAEVL